jgi:DNA-binding NtrC family response regulator
MACRIIVIDDEQDFLDSLRRGLYTSGYRDLQLIQNPKEAAELFERGEIFEVALIDITMPEMTGLELLAAIKSYSPSTECIMVTAVNEAKVAVECLRKGAYDYLTKPISRDDLVLKISHALEKKRLLDIVHLKRNNDLPELTLPDAFKPILTQSAKVMGILKEAELHAASEMPVLITGESGTGKELLARAIHCASPRAKFPFMPINMASLTGSLFDAEFFGHTRGAFTGAEKDRTGHLEHTKHGTLFLDEIGNLPLELQGKLLRVLQEGEFVKLGTSRLQKADIRFIAATNEDINRLVSKNLFRKDLYYRLKGAWLHLPPLRERREDIPLLIRAFLEEFAARVEVKGIDEQALATLMEYDYPGNIRELRSLLQAAVNLAHGMSIALHHLPDSIRSRRPSARPDSQAPSSPVPSLADVEKLHILKIYHQTSENKSQTARLLGIGMNTLRRKLEAFGIE